MFIAEIMDAHEEIDDASDTKELNVVLKLYQGQNCFGLLASTFNPASPERVNLILEEIDRLIGSGQWREAKDATVKLKYLENICSTARERLQK